MSEISKGVTGKLAASSLLVSCTSTDYNKSVYD